MIRIALSFDNGPEPEVTPRVLDLLAARGVRASFFVLGKKIATAAGAPLVERASREGHVVGNHSFSHEIPLGDDPRSDATLREIVATERELDRVVPGAPRLFRPFGGGGAIGPHLLSPAAARYLVDGAYTCVLWNSVPRDWEDEGGWDARALADCVDGAHVSLVLHDLPSACLARLPSFLDEALARGASFVVEQPASCVPIVAGRVRGDLASIVRAEPR